MISYRTEAVCEIVEIVGISIEQAFRMMGAMIAHEGQYTLTYVNFKRKFSYIKRQSMIFNICS